MLEFFKLITHLGDAYFIIGISILISIIIKDYKKSISIFLNLILAFLLNQGLKQIFKIPRPNNNIISVSGYSFPSGHAMVSLAFYGFLIYLIFKITKNKKTRIISIVGLSLLILLIGISRVYLRVHYPIDIICGFIFALIYLIMYIKIVNKRIW